MKKIIGSLSLIVILLSTILSGCSSKSSAAIIPTILIFLLFQQCFIKGSNISAGMKG